MRRSAEIARHSMQGAWQAMRAANDAASQALANARRLAMSPAERQRIADAAEVHARNAQAAILAMQAAVDSSVELMALVDRTETSHVGFPVLPPAAGRSAQG